VESPRIAASEISRSHSLAPQEGQTGSSPCEYSEMLERISISRPQRLPRYSQTGMAHSPVLA